LSRCLWLRRAKRDADRMPHSGRSLLDHLVGTRQLLVDGGARPPVCNAGLIHFVYGTRAGRHRGRRPTGLAATDAPNRVSQTRTLSARLL
jgi:hypothetical protein